MGQIKNIKLHIVTDIKRIKPQKDESQVEEEKSAKVEEKEKKDERKIKVGNSSCYGDGKNNKREMKQTKKLGVSTATLSSSLDHIYQMSCRKQPLDHDRNQRICDTLPGLFLVLFVVYLIYCGNPLLKYI